MPKLPRSMREPVGLMGGDAETTEDRLHVLTNVIFELLVEVEALRAERIESSRRKGGDPSKSPYAKAYADTRLLTYNGAGPTQGTDKLLRLWFGRSDSDSVEVGMLTRLGYSPGMLHDFREKAKHLASLS
jgi:hypothetical protein